MQVFMPCSRCACTTVTMEAESTTTHSEHGADTEAHAPESVGRRVTVPRLAIPALPDTPAGDAASPSAADLGAAPPTTPFPAAVTPAGDGDSVDLSAMPTARILQHLYRQAATEAKAAGRPPPAEAPRHLNPFRMRLMSIGRVTAAKKTIPGTPMGPCCSHNSSISTVDVAASYAAVVAASAGVQGHAVTAVSNPPTNPHPSVGRAHLPSPVAANSLYGSRSSCSSPHSVHMDADLGENKQQHHLHPPVSPTGKRPAAMIRCTSRFAAGTRQACDVPALQPPVHPVEQHEHVRQLVTAARPVSAPQQGQQQQQQQRHVGSGQHSLGPHILGAQMLEQSHTRGGGLDITLGRWVSMRGETAAATSNGGVDFSFEHGTEGAAQQHSQLQPSAWDDPYALQHAAAAAAAPDEANDAGDSCYREVEEGCDKVEVTLLVGVKVAAEGPPQTPPCRQRHCTGSSMLSHHGQPDSSSSSSSSSSGPHAMHSLPHQHTCGAGCSCEMGSSWCQGVQRGSASAGVSGAHTTLSTAMHTPAGSHRSQQRPVSAPHAHVGEQVLNKRMSEKPAAGSSSSTRRRAWSAVQCPSGSHQQYQQHQGLGVCADNISSGRMQASRCTSAAAAGCTAAASPFTRGQRCTAPCATRISCSPLSSGRQHAAPGSECSGSRSDHLTVDHVGPRRCSSSDAAPVRGSSDQPTANTSSSNWWETVAVQKQRKPFMRPCSAAETRGSRRKCCSSPGGHNAGCVTAASRPTSCSKGRAECDGVGQPVRRRPVSACGPCKPSDCVPVATQQQLQRQRMGSDNPRRPASSARATSLRTRTKLQVQSLPHGWWRQPASALSDPLLLQLPGWVRLDLDLELLDT